MVNRKAMSKNANLRKANKAKNDEFYTIRTSSEEKEQRIPPHLLMRG